MSGPFKNTEEEGADAKKGGKWHDANPYPPGSADNAAWDSGWREEERKSYDDDDLDE